MIRRFRRGVAVFVVALLVSATFVTGDLGNAGADPRPTPTGYDVLFVRHAHASPSNGPLSELGLAQAAALAELLDEEPVNAVYTSMLVRAFQTGAPVASGHDVSLVADERINEIEFDFTGVPPADIVEVLNELFRQWLLGENRDEGLGAGESFNDVQSRWNEWWASFVAEHRTDKGTAVVVAHGALLGMMIPEICHNDLDPDFVLREREPGVFLPNAGIIETRLHPNGTLSCTVWAGDAIPSAVAATS